MKTSIVYLSMLRTWLPSMPSRLLDYLDGIATEHVIPSQWKISVHIYFCHALLIVIYYNSTQRSIKTTKTQVNDKKTNDEIVIVMLYRCIHDHRLKLRNYFSQAIV